MAIDLVKPLKLEDNPGDMDQFPTEVDPTEDYSHIKGIAIEDENTLVDKAPDGSVQFTDTNNGVKTLRQVRNEALVFSIALGG